MIVHLHCVSWNNMGMLDYFFRHYDPLVAHYFISDDGSDDGSLEYFSRRSNVSVRRKPTSHASSYVLESHSSHQSSWRRSRGIADWVFVVDIDEHLHHADLRDYLRVQAAVGVTAIPALGFQMLARQKPPPEVRLADHLQWGAPWKQMSKLVAFRPDAITDPGFEVGRHRAEPVGKVRYPERDELLLLHYKYIGLDALHHRHTIAQARRRELDLARGWGHRYSFDEAQLSADFAAFQERAIDLSQMPSPHEQHREPRWWRPSLPDCQASERSEPASGARAGFTRRLGRLLRPPRKWLRSWGVPRGR
jgi:hypothetical protein